MKHKASAFLAIIGLLAAVGPTSAAPASERNDLQVIRKAVRDNSPEAPETMKDVKWFKVLVTDNRTNKDKVRISLPIVLIEALSRFADDSRIKFEREACGVDFVALLAELKKIGPMAIIEVHDENETIKVWFE